MSISIVTWNAQGSPLNDDDKRATLVGMCSAFDVILLQECGGFASVDRFEGKRVVAQEQVGAFNNRCSTATGLVTDFQRAS